MQREGDCREKDCREEDFIEKDCKGGVFKMIFEVVCKFLGLYLCCTYTDIIQVAASNMLTAQMTDTFMPRL